MFCFQNHGYFEVMMEVNILVRLVGKLQCEMCSKYRQDIRLKNIDVLVYISGISAVMTLSSCFNKIRNILSGNKDFCKA